MKKIDLNVDIAEGFPNDEALLQVVTSANVCCGAHAGTWELTTKTVNRCRELGIRVGAHPGFPDRENMGRTIPNLEALNSYSTSLFQQVERFVEEFDADYIKPHGAWYNLMTTPLGHPEGDRAREIVAKIAKAFQVPIMALANSSYSQFLEGEGIAIITEGFADRGYTKTGALIPRSEPGAVLTDREAVSQQAVELAERVDSICLHGDTLGCLDFARHVRTTLERSGFEVSP